MPFDGTQLDDVTKLLIEGRERIERGWCQGAMRGAHGAVCTVGALNYDGVHNGMFAGAVKRLERAAGIPPDRNLPHWNDRPERTKDDVLAVYDDAIAQIT